MRVAEVNNAPQAAGALSTLGAGATQMRWKQCSAIWRGEVCRDGSERWRDPLCARCDRAMVYGRGRGRGRGASLT
jgi:hypothetical protein